MKIETMDDIMSALYILDSELYEGKIDPKQASKQLHELTSKLEDIIVEHDLWKLTS